jgi:hypothetical protein
MHKSATKCNETLRKCCKNKHGASKIMDTFETYHPALPMGVAPEAIVEKLISSIGSKTMCFLSFQEIIM